jgi:hypothetical protein
VPEPPIKKDDIADDRPSLTAEKDRPDWLVRGALARIGDSIDRLTGRKRNASSIATSELIKRLILVLESEKRTEGSRTFVPHNIRLKLQWNKFSDNKEEDMEQLREELSIAAIDHINDCLYFTHAPLNLEVKRDYFVEGAKILASFEDLSVVDPSAVEADITLTGGPEENDIRIPTAPTPKADDLLELEFRFRMGAQDVVKVQAVNVGDRLRIGRHDSNDIAVSDSSISKFHCTILIGSENEVIIADTGSTNGTTVNGQRIEYGGTKTIIREGALGVGDVRIHLKMRKRGSVTGEEVDNIHARYTSGELPGSDNK